MIVSNIDQYKGGWFIGNFDSSILKTNLFEVAHHFYKQGFIGITHTHKIATEYNYILSGKVIVSGQHLSSGNIFVYEPNDISNVIFLEDTNLIIIKTPSCPDDKYLVNTD